jgi:hypothetical protein
MNIISESSRKNKTKIKTKRIISESSRKNKAKTKTKQIISKSSKFIKNPVILLKISSLCLYS